MIDIEKFICSLLADHPVGVTVREDIHKALKDQGLEYKGGKIVPIEDKTALQESEDEKIRKAIIESLPKYGYLPQTNIKVEDAIAWLEKQGSEPNWCHHKVDLSNCSEEYCKAYYDGWNNCNMQHSQCKTESDAVVKCLINGMKFYYEDNKEATWGTEKFSMKVKDILSWLEKQGEQTTVDKVEPKFKVGDWIVSNVSHEDYRICKILNDDGEYIIESIYGYRGHNNFETFDKDYHLWTIQDAKGGDVLHSTGWHSDCIFIFNGLDNWKFDEPNGDRAVATGYCCLSVSADNMEFGIQGPDCVEINTIKPATKIQRGLLFQKMKESGYEWDTEKKELKKFEQKTADKVKPKFKVGDKIRKKTPSSFDRDMQVARIEKDYYVCNHIGKFSSEVVSFSKESSYELIEQTPAWSKEDKVILDEIIDFFENGTVKLQHDLSLYASWLKSIKERYAWKLSNEQLHYLYWIANVRLGDSVVEQEVSKHLNELLEDLKKLRDAE